jgi:hypothetical protein
VNALEMVNRVRALQRKHTKDLDDLAEEIESERQSSTEDWIDQTQTKLGPRRHCKIVQHRVVNDLPGAQILGRRHLLSPAAHAEERAKIGKVRLARCATKQPERCGTETGSAYDRAMARATKAGAAR